MSTITLNIKGRDWKFSLFSDKKFDKLHNPDGVESIAMTLAGSYEVHFRKSNWDVVTIRHELLHVLVSMSLVSSADLSSSDVEELCAEIVGHHSTEIIHWSDRITECFLGRK